ncbi:hypothetical protein OIE63_13385 [Streptomyces sp. NBC_01795]|uniref:hypothetical protein n=1 Tax=unclassified Streptomyces TaxID=2593676 RepID=UPI002DDB6284|nr:MULTISPECIES: hypothetical protein [unclassified Streptomyces]WSA92444.1 hypothetical protein OIE63_13385 [Streptomyces sp. NBC_01795]WSB76810.1 hypothetical protein OHB04_14190 [Streptomyces sp. NBC_01775]
MTNLFMDCSVLCVLGVADRDRARALFPAVETGELQGPHWCELGGGHQTHQSALHLYDDSTTLWVTWTSTGHRLVVLPDCPVHEPDPMGSACILSQRHEGPHSWEFLDDATRLRFYGLELPG